MKSREFSPIPSFLNSKPLPPDIYTHTVTSVQNEAPQRRRSAGFPNSKFNPRKHAARRPPSHSSQNPGQLKIPQIRSELFRPKGKEPRVISNEITRGRVCGGPPPPDQAPRPVCPSLVPQSFPGIAYGISFWSRNASMPQYRLTTRTWSSGAQLVIASLLVMVTSCRFSSPAKGDRSTSPSASNCSVCSSVMPESTCRS